MTSVPCVGEHASELRQRAVAPDVEDEVVAPAVVGDVGVRVVDHVIGAERAHEVDLLGAGDAGDVRSERLGDLDGEGADASRCTDDQHVLTGLHAAAVAQRLQRGDGGDGNGGGLLEAQVRRHPRQLVRSRRGVLGERRAAGAVYRLARLESRDLAADRLDDPGELRAEAGGLGPAQAEAGNADQVGQPGHDVPRAAVKPGRADAYEHRLIADPGHFDVAEVQDISRAVAVAHDRLHRPPGRLRRFGICTWESSGWSCHSSVRPHSWRDGLRTAVVRGG